MSERGLVVITGAAGGLGLACARNFAPRHPLLLVDAAGEELAKATQELEGEGASVRSVVCDLGRDQEIVAIADAIAAGLSPAMATAARILEVNLRGTARVLEAALPAAGPGTVAVCVASIAGHRRRAAEFDALLANPLRADLVADLEAAAGGGELPSTAGYALSKRGVILLCERQAGEWGERGARIVSVSPSLIDTPMGRIEHGANAAGMLEGLLAATASKRIATTADIVAAVDFLCSDAAGYITGTDLRIDGGSVATFTHGWPAEERERWEDPWKAAAYAARPEV